MTTTKESKRILSVKVERMADYDADTSDLGEYSDDPKQYAIVAVGGHEGEFYYDLPCSECGRDQETCENDNDADHGFDRDEPARGREYRYFNPCAENYEGCTEDEIKKYCLQDYERMRDLQRGEWSYVGIKAQAQVKLNGDLVQTIHSGGLWGIESDAGDSDFREIESEQLDELRGQLAAIGFSKRAVAAAMRNVERS